MSEQRDPAISDTGRPVPPPPTLIARAFKRQCPMCGQSGVWTGWWTLRDSCPNCGYVFRREGGYFLGAYALNLVFAELVTMVILTYLLIWTDWEWWEIELVVIPLAIGLPIIFFPISRGLWMALDLILHPKNQR